MTDARELQSMMEVLDDLVSAVQDDCASYERGYGRRLAEVRNARQEVHRIHAAALERLEALEAALRTAFPTALMRATIYGSFSMANAVLEERDYDGNWREVAWSEDDKPPMEALRELLETYQPIGATSAPAGAEDPAPDGFTEEDRALWGNTVGDGLTPYEGGE